MIQPVDTSVIGIETWKITVQLEDVLGLFETITREEIFEIEFICTSNC